MSIELDLTGENRTTLSLDEHRMTGNLVVTTGVPASEGRGEVNISVELSRDSVATLYQHLGAWLRGV